jgi:hypothetical protein
LEKNINIVSKTLCPPTSSKATSYPDVVFLVIFDIFCEYAIMVLVIYKVMHMNETYKQLKELIVEIVPDIIKLERGCCINIKTNTPFEKLPFNHTGEYMLTYDMEYTKMLFVPVYGAFYEGNKSFKTLPIKKDVFERLQKYGNIEIIGRDITLEDTMIAIGNSGNWFIDDRGLFIRSNRKEFTYNYVQPNIQWYLGKPLNRQEESTWEFLLNILKKV